MTYTIDIVKEIIHTFIEENNEESIELKTKKGEKFLVNQSICELEHYLTDLRKSHHINERIDHEIYSEGMFTKLTRISAADAYQPVDYQYSFLYHLAEAHYKNSSLYGQINSFIEKIKQVFTLADITITSTGVTRSKTNIRFALNDLRDIGLVARVDSHQKRTHAPSIIGLMVLMNIRMNQSQFEKEKLYKSPLWLQPKKDQKLDKLPTHLAYDPLVIKSLSQFKEPGYLYSYLSMQRDWRICEEEKKLLDTIMGQYVDFVGEGLLIVSDGIKQTQKFNELSKTFQQNLLCFEKQNTALYQKLYAQFGNNNG
jgi:hypothetical protein